MVPFRALWAKTHSPASRGLTAAAAAPHTWLNYVHGRTAYIQAAGEIELDAPGFPSAGSSDHSSFVCRGAPAFWLLSRSWDYGTYTWHTNRDTYDKLVAEDLRGSTTESCFPGTS